MWEGPRGLFLLKQMPLYLEDQKFIFNNIECHDFAGGEEKGHSISGIQDVWSSLDSEQKQCVCDETLHFVPSVPF